MELRRKVSGVEENEDEGRWKQREKERERLSELRLTGGEVLLVCRRKILRTM